MAQTDPRDTAKIVDLTAFRRARAVRAGALPAKPERQPAMGGGAWYHEAAIRDEDRSRT
ncbi:DUF2735 domain-containing protein [Methylobacterium sp. NEAU 140]|uniref:DUF2735 domain-containing protein n=1 Tax=Methylobacterium sp. NEAU 140 TaxID=3064945 RepID=UPI002735625F|nr:DUF2735 domain-containing protein [Methylobacterium sp. NEAU 140]MDP4026549.1 DUF2735 domain-containing protein [Methylobacterium sp. NEAU 140]